MKLKEENKFTIKRTRILFVIFTAFLLSLNLSYSVESEFQSCPLDFETHPNKTDHCRCKGAHSQGMQLYPVKVDAFGNNIPLNDSELSNDSSNWLLKANIHSKVLSDKLHCACGLLSHSVTKNDQSLRTFTAPYPLLELFPHGPLLTWPEGSNAPVCACPNVNEIPVSVEDLSIRSGSVTQCLPVPSLLSAPYSARLDDLKNQDFSYQFVSNGQPKEAKKSILRAQSTNENSVGSHQVFAVAPTSNSHFNRKIWKCPAGTTLNPQTQTCEAPLLQNHTCGDSGTSLPHSLDLNATISTLLKGNKSDWESRVVNKRLVCCMSDQSSSRGLVSEDGTGAVSHMTMSDSVLKFHCRASQMTSSTGRAFTEYYNEGGPLGRAMSVEESAGLVYPNRLYLTDDQGNPLIGFYSSEGKRCSDKEIHINGPESKKKLLELLAHVESMKVEDYPFIKHCPIAVRTAVEVTCPNNGISGSSVEIKTISKGAIHACTSLQTVTAIYQIIHLKSSSLSQGSSLVFKTRMNGQAGSIAKPIDISSIIKFKQLGCAQDGEVLVAGRCEKIQCSGNSIRVRSTCVQCPGALRANQELNQCL